MQHTVNLAKERRKEDEGVEELACGNTSAAAPTPGAVTAHGASSCFAATSRARVSARGAPEEEVEVIGAVAGGARAAATATGGARAGEDSRAVE